MERMIYRTPEALALVEDGRLAEYLDIRDDARSGDIVMAKVDRMMPGLECAFADIGRKKDGFLPLKENSRSFSAPPLHSGDRIPVQIRREETGEKGAFLSRDLTLPGALVILMPCNRYIGVSSRIRDEQTREALRGLGAEIMGERAGLVLRAAAESASENEIIREAETLWETWQEIRIRVREAQLPGDVLYACDPAALLIRDYGSPPLEDCEELPPAIRRELAVAGNRKVPLPSGGNLVIDRCEALTVIDVNSASARGEGGKEFTVTAVNLEACKEAALQIRLRDLSGIILIDFIDMASETDQSLVCEALENALSADRRKTVLHGWTRLGLMEMTRKRV